jgi:aminopeptidase YwaD
VDAGTGRQEDFPPEAAGAVVLIQRRDVRFVDMARRAREAGAVAAVVANKEPGLFQGILDPPSELPFLAIDRADGDALRELLAAGPVEVAVRVEELREVTAHNVIARPESEQCRTLSGGHYDTVPWAAGANDNASGSAMVLELARAAAAASLSGHCFVLFGAEEEGLLGSAFFVSELSEEERDELKAFFNYDVVAGDARPLVIGGEELLDRAETQAERAGLDIQLSARSREIISDHRVFLNAGIPALMLTTPDFDRVHTAGDTLANLEPPSLDAIAALGFGFLSEIGRGR